MNIGVPKHSELEPDCFLAEGNGDAAQCCRLSSSEGIKRSKAVKRVYTHSGLEPRSIGQKA